MTFVWRILMLTGLAAAMGCSNTGNPSGSTPDRDPKSGTTRSIDSVAVLPFTGHWDKPDIADATWPQRVRGLLEEIIPDAISSDLVEQAPPGTLKVVPTATAREKKLVGQPTAEAGKALKVGAVLAGKVTGGGELSVQLVAVESGALLWGKTYKLSFGFSDEHGTWRMSILDRDRQDIVGNVVSKLTGKEAVVPKKGPAVGAEEPKQSPSAKVLLEDRDRLLQPAWWESGEVKVKRKENKEETFTLLFSFKPDIDALKKEQARGQVRLGIGVPEKAGTRKVITGPDFDWELSEKDGRRILKITLGKDRVAIPYKLADEVLNVTEVAKINWPSLGVLTLPTEFKASRTK